MKTSVITAAPHVRNYGSVLLTYATMRLFEKHGLTVEFVDYTRHTVEEAESLKELFFAISRRDRFRHLPRTAQWCIALLLYPSTKRQQRAFQTFIKAYLPLTPKRYDNNFDLVSAPPQADIYCTGGDQMWNEQHNGHQTLEAFYLTFAPQSKLRISFCTSIGKERLDPCEIPEVLPLLKKYDFISVREYSAKKALEEIGVSNVQQLLDPVLLLDREEWEKMAAPRLIEEDYVLCYEMSRRKSITPAALKVKQVSGKKLVRINLYTFDAIKRGKSILCPTPEEFLSLFRYADFVVTNSFHGMAFSIVYERQFMVISGANSARLENALDLLGLRNRICKSAERIAECYSEQIDYSNVNRRLIEERLCCDAYIREAIQFAKCS